ncbi:MAG: sugar ABC transporter ATP-binding protein [Lachnospiraceae bacterium]|nr:sugar ABC transporter ATP-binding protein [Lachnospiraceae bacterium]MCI8995996.1 sugar ABC transporter ATP-binding protein [Lachnospiraceae bacterium]
MENVLEARGLTKYFPAMKALDNIDFDLRAGEVHILLGENGAGKSTLAKCLLGAYMPEEGEIFLKGEKLHLLSAKDALEKGIAAVYQEFTLVPYLTVAQNIFLNREFKNRAGLIDHKAMEEKAKEYLHILNCDYINVKSVVKKLSVAEQQMVEIAKALSFQPKIIVFDEPTATLTEREIESLFVQIHKLKAEGIGIVYVSHRMQEFSQIGDRITVMRDGRRIGTVRVGEKSDEELVKMMVGRDVTQVYVRNYHVQEEIALETQNLQDRDGRVKDVSIQVRKGEIVGLSGLVGAGRTETARLIFGIDQIKSGKLMIHGKEITGKNTPLRMVRQGIGMVCEDRKQQGLALKDSVAWNIMAVSLKRYFPNGIIDHRRMMEICREWKEELGIATPDVHKQCKFLSGGNQQKVVLAKWLSNGPDILIFDEPTRGIDIGAKMEIYTRMDQLAAEGKAILLISSELPEVIGMSDRIYVMSEGRIMTECIRGEENFNQEAIGAMMLGIGGDEHGKE